MHRLLAEESDWEGSAVAVGSSLMRPSGNSIPPKDCEPRSPPGRGKLEEVSTSARAATFTLFAVARTMLKRQTVASHRSDMKGLRKRALAQA